MSNRVKFWILLMVLMSSSGVFAQSSMVVKDWASTTAPISTTVTYDNPMNTSPGSQVVRDYASPTANATSVTPIALESFRPVFVGNSTPTAAVTGVLYMWFATDTSKLMFKYTLGAGLASAAGALN